MFYYITDMTDNVFFNMVNTKIKKLYCGTRNRSNSWMTLIAILHVRLAERHRETPCGLV